MQIVKLFIFAVLFMFSSTVFSYGQIYKNIIPMHSSCEDVKKILGVETCAKSREFYNLKTEKIEISYSTENRQKAYLKKWNVPIGTVLSVIRILKEPVLLSNLSIDLTMCETYTGTTDVIGETKYSCE